MLDFDNVDPMKLDQISGEVLDRKELRKKFDEIDFDRNGYITSDEFQNFWHFESEIAEEIVRKADRDGDG